MKKTKQLTSRQAEVLQLKANGQTDKQVAYQLGLSSDRVNQINQSIRLVAKDLTGIHYENLIGAAFALQLAGVFEYEPLSLPVQQQRHSS